MPGRRSVKWRDEVLDYLETLSGTPREKAAALTAKFHTTYNNDQVRSQLVRSRNNVERPPMVGDTPSFEERKEAARKQLDKAHERGTIDMEARREAFSDLLLDVLRTSIAPLQFKQPAYRAPQPASGEAEQAVLVLSDWHFGKLTPEYNMAVARERFVQLCEKARSIVSLHRRAYPVRVLNILWNGDMVDGDGIYPTQGSHLDDHVVNQIFKNTPTIVGELATLAGYFDQVNNYCVRGNHGRVSKFAHEDANWDNIFYKVLEQATAQIPNMTWTIPAGWYCLFDVDRLRILGVHGHQIKMTLNLPWYGITTRISRWATTEQLGHFDIAVTAHFHASSRLRWNNKRLFTNGTGVAGDPFALEVLGLESSQCQWLFGVRGNRVTWDYELDFE